MEGGGGGGGERGNGVIKVDEKDFTDRIHLIVTGLFRCFHLLHIYKYIISYQISSIYLSNKKNDLYFKKPGKIYYFSTFRGHRDSIIKRLVK